MMRLRNAEINPGRLCNNRCVFCMSGVERDRREPWAPLSTVRRELRRHYEAGARSVGFIGGEPSAYPHIEACVGRARELGYRRIAICTNGTRLSESGFLGRLVRAGLTRATISVHSRRPEVEDALTGVPGNWERKLQGVREAVRLLRAGHLRDNVSLNAVLCRQNMRDLEGYVRFFAQEGVKDFRFNFIWPQGRARRDPRVVPRYGEAVPWILRAIHWHERQDGLRLSFGGVPYCVLPEPSRRSTAFLRKYFHEEGLDLPTDVSLLRVGRERGTERFNWQARSRDEYRSPVASCRSCRFRNVCMGVYRTYLELYGDAEFGEAGAAARARHPRRPHGA